MKMAKSKFLKVLNFFLKIFENQLISSHKAVKYFTENFLYITQANYSIIFVQLGPHLCMLNGNSNDMIRNLILSVPDHCLSLNFPEWLYAYGSTDIFATIQKMYTNFQTQIIILNQSCQVLISCSFFFIIPQMPCLIIFLPPH